MQVERVTLKSIYAIKQKDIDFMGSVEKMHGGYTNEPKVFGNYIFMELGVTFKGMSRMEIKEMCRYEVKMAKLYLKNFTINPLGSLKSEMERFISLFVFYKANIQSSFWELLIFGTFTKNYISAKLHQFFFEMVWMIGIPTKKSYQLNKHYEQSRREKARILSTPSSSRKSIWI